MSIHSPKAKYRAEIDFEKAVKGIGSVSTFSSDSKESLLAWASGQVKIARTPAQVIIYENQKEHPEFEWTMAQCVYLGLDGKEDVRKTIGAQLQAARRERGMTQKQVADAIGMRQGYVTRMECGHIAPNVATITRYLDAIGGYKVAVVKK